MMHYDKKTYDFDNFPNWLTFLRDEINLTALGMSFARLPAGKGYTYLHKHKKQEEVYVILQGRGVII